MSEFSLYPKGDRAITISFGNLINKETHLRVKKAFHRLKQKNEDSILDIVPTYTAITIYYNWLDTSYYEMKEWIEDCLVNYDADEIVSEDVIVEIPVCYGNKFGPDLSRVAEQNHMTEEDVIDKHSSPLYLIYMMGFLPGFPYLGGLKEELATPRLKKPRINVEAGSVGIAGNQTGIYSITSPGGWNIIGKTPIQIFDQNKKKPFLLELGNYIKFVPITIDEYYALVSKSKFT